MKRKFSWLLAVIFTITMIGQIVLAFIFYKDAKYEIVQNIGWAFMVVSAVFGWLPMFTFRKRGAVSKGKSYMMTTKLVDQGLYSIVRHPQYLAGHLLAISLYLITQQWASLLLGLLNMVQCYLSAMEEERDSKEKFGTAYDDYMQRVPRFNFILGIARKFIA